MNVFDAIFDPELGYTGFTVQRTTYCRQNGFSGTAAASRAGRLALAAPL